MTLNINKYLGFGLLLAAILATGALLAVAQQVYAGSTYDKPTPVDNYVDHTFFTATTTTATSTNAADLPDRTLRVDGADDVVLYFGRGDTKGTGNSGSTVFKVQTSRDGSEWFDYNTLLLNSATSSPTSFAFVTLPAGTSTVQARMQYNGYHFIRCISVETTDGEATCRASVTR